jgi:FkbM family methyltransferase
MNRVVRKVLRACRLYDVAGDLKDRLARTEARYVRFYSKFVTEGDLCFDVGANVGRRTRVLLRLGASVVAVEPQPQCMRALEKKYGENPNVALVQKAVGEKTGQAEMMISDSPSLSSLSQEWVKSVQRSGRFQGCSWNGRITVPVVTLDDLITEYGNPVFIKLDIEGYEYEALKGLTRPISVISFEFTPEFGDSATKAIERISQIGRAGFNYALARDLAKLVLPQWIGPEQMLRAVTQLQEDGTVGDIYARFDL